MQYYVPDILIRRSRVTPLTLTALTAGSKVTLTKVGSPPDVSLQYSTGGAWATYTIGTEITLASAGDYIKFRGDNSTFSTTANDYYRFVMSGTIGASGNVMSLVDSTCKSLTIPGDYCFRFLFAYCTSLTTAPALPATTLAAYCYREMFRGCTSLTTAPALPATTLATWCYSSMFYSCTSLTTAPALPATTLATECYTYMFAYCTKLTTAPALPVTTLAANCYSSMFRGCTSLTTAPALPATTLAIQCYGYMFNGCTSLTTAPALPATTLATQCYGSMFRGCTSLTTAPALPATTLATQCYSCMFNGCTKLSSIEVSFTSWTQAGDQTGAWVDSVASSGTFTKPAALATEYGANRIPTGWTVIDK